MRAPGWRNLESHRANSGNSVFNSPERLWVIAGGALLTNDDGWDALGLAALRQAAADLGRCVVIAPSHPLSGCGHRVTTLGPITVTEPAAGILAVAGTPADCVRLALHHLAPELSWVLAGINNGGNLGADVYHSGTVAAAREGILHGVPGIALSQYIARGATVDWSRSAGWARDVLAPVDGTAPRGRNVLERQLSPHRARRSRAGSKVLSARPFPTAPRISRAGRPSRLRGQLPGERIRRPGSDVDVCFGGGIAVTMIRVSGLDFAPLETEPSDLAPVALWMNRPTLP